LFIAYFSELKTFFKASAYPTIAHHIFIEIAQNFKQEQLHCG